MRLVPLLVLLSQAVCLPLLAWLTAFRHLNRRLLAGFYNAVFALAGLILAVALPAVYGALFTILLALLFRGAANQFAAATVENRGTES